MGNKKSSDFYFEYQENTLTLDKVTTIQIIRQRKHATMTTEKTHRTQLVIFDLDGTLLNTIDDLATATICAYMVIQSTN